MFLGLTGGIGCGKSTVARMFETCGAYVIDADVIARSMFNPGTQTRAYLDETYGSDMLDGSGEINRKYLADQIFSNELRRAELEEVMHPELSREVARLRAEHEPSQVVVYDSPLLVEKGLGRECDAIVVVTAPLEQRIERLVARGLDRNDISRRMEIQATDAQRVAVADFVIANDSSEADLEAKVLAVWQKITSGELTA